METAVIAGVSHKGGTGRSVTLANLAFHLHFSGPYNVCIVDLDLASPTMGSVLEIEGLERGQVGAGKSGAPRSVHDILAYSDDPLPALVDIRTKSKSVIAKHRPEKQFALVPGLAQSGDWAQKLQGLRSSLKNMIERLRGSDFDYIILDVRSGLSDVLEALGKDANDLVDMLIVHFRWTPQHLAGLDSMLNSERVGNFGADKLRLIRTAFIAPSGEPPEIQSFARSLDAQMREKLSKIEWGDRGLDPDRMPFLGTVPMDPTLKWKECILTEESGPSKSTFTVYREIAGKIVAQVRG